MLMGGHASSNVRVELYCKQSNANAISPGHASVNPLAFKGGFLWHAGPGDIACTQAGCQRAGHWQPASIRVGVMRLPH